MPQTRRRISRQELYDLIWERPMSKVAPEFGLSGVGLAKLCRREGIPVPDRGYWAKLEHGKRVKKPALKGAAPDRSEDLFIAATPPRLSMPEDEMPEPLAKLLRTEREATEPIVVPLSPKPHPIVAAWERPHKSFSGVAQFTPATESRRRRIASVFFREVEKRGGSVKAETAQKFKVTFFGATIDVALKERLKAVDVLADPKKPYSYPHKDWHPTGALRLRFENYFEVRLRREWNETEEKALEGRLREIFVALFMAIEAERKRTERFAEVARRRAEEEIRRYEREELQRKEKAKQDGLMTEIVAWENACRIRKYVEAVRARDPEKNEVWGTWALEVARSLDPTEGGVP